MEGLTNSWVLAPFGLVEPFKVTNEHVIIAEVRLMSLHFFSPYGFSSLWLTLQSCSPSLCLGVKGRSVISIGLGPGEVDPRPLDGSPKSEDSATKNKHHWEKVKKGKEALEAEKRGPTAPVGRHLLQSGGRGHRGAEKAAEAVGGDEHQGYWRGHEKVAKAEH